MVDPKETEAMARLLQIMNGSSPEQEIVTESANSFSAPVSVDPKDDMKRIIESFNRGIGSVAETLAEPVTRMAQEAEVSRPLREAMVTRKTPQGVKIGSWEIKVYEDQGIKTYDVMNSVTNQAIANDLSLYESALCLAKLLNNGVGINNPKVREVLELEEKYAHHRQEAAMFKARATSRLKLGESERAAIAEDRFTESRELAVKYRQKIVDLSKIL